MKKMFALLIVLMLVSLACQLPLKASSIPPTPIPVSTEAAGEVESQMATAAADLKSSGKVNVTFSETQLTSYVAQKLAADQSIPIKDPQVLLHDGVMELSGKATVGLITANARIVLEPFADQGNLGINIREAKLGSVPFPATMLESVSQAINQNLNDLISVEGEKFYLETIQISDGNLTLSGKLQ